MTIHYVSSREFSRDPGSAKKAADDGPVFITNRERPAHVLMNIEEYRRLTAGRKSLAEMLAPGPELDGIAEIEFDPPRSQFAAHVPELD